SPLWTEQRKHLLAVLSESESNQAVQANAYELIQWFYHMLREQPERGDSQNVGKILSDKEILDALWNAATASQLGPHAIARMRDFPETVKKLGLELTLPSWWEPTLTGFRKQAMSAADVTETVASPA